MNPKVIIITTFNSTRPLVSFLRNDFFSQQSSLSFQCLFHDLLNQNQACLYSFECISHGDSKYSHEIPKFCHLFFIFYFLLVFSTRLPRFYVKDLYKMFNTCMASSRFGDTFDNYMLKHFWIHTPAVLENCTLSLTRCQGNLH